MLGSILSLQPGAFTLILQTLLSGITELAFGKFLMLMQPIHIGVGIAEGLITSAVLIFIYESRPELLTNKESSSKLSLKKLITILTITVMLIGGGLSLFASSNPDGLEWSIEKLTGTTEIEAEGGVYDMMSNLQETTVILPNYGFLNSDNKILGTSFSGIMGSIAVCMIVAGLFKIFNKFKKVLFAQ